MTATIVLYVPGATAEELAHGVEVAQAILERDGVSLEAARHGFDERTRRNTDPILHPLAETALIKTWFSYDAARWAAIATCIDRAGAAEVDCLFEIVVDPPIH